MFFTAFRNTPFLDELTASFVRALIAQEKIGQGASADFLSISFSATDYVGHAFGPNSVEYEDNLLHLDATLADLLEYVDRTVGSTLGQPVSTLVARGASFLPNLLTVILQIQRRDK